MGSNALFFVVQKVNCIFSFKDQQEYEMNIAISECLIRLQKYINQQDSSFG